MHKKKPLIYRVENRQYCIDDCLPQREAIELGKVGFHAISSGHYPGTLIAPRLLPGVSSMGCFDVSEPQDWGIPTHRNEGIEIIFQETGTSNFMVDGDFNLLAATHLGITRPWQPHSLGAPNLKPGKLHWLILDVGVRRPHQPWHWPDWCILTDHDQKELVEKLRCNELPVWRATPEILQNWRQLNRLTAHREPETVISQIRIHLNHLLSGLLDLFRSENFTTDPSLTSIRRSVALFIRELESQPELLAEPWTLDAMAESCGIKRTTFSTYCREMTNLSPSHLLNHLRLSRASRQLLAEPGKNITEIAMAVGFSSSQYFSRKFSAKFGLNPRAYRNQHLKNSAGNYSCASHA